MRCLTVPLVGLLLASAFMAGCVDASSTNHHGTRVGSAQPVVAVADRMGTASGATWGDDDPRVRTRRQGLGHDHGELVWYCTQCRYEHGLSGLDRMDGPSGCDASSSDPPVMRSDGCPVSGRLP